MVCALAAVPRTTIGSPSSRPAPGGKRIAAVGAGGGGGPPGPPPPPPPPPPPHPGRAAIARTRTAKASGETSERDIEHLLRGTHPRPRRDAGGRRNLPRARLRRRAPRLLATLR